MNESELSGLVALVTGGTNGIGRAICNALQDSGAKVAFTGRDADKGKRLEAETGQGFYSCDNRSPEQVMRCCNSVQDRFGPITILVNNAGNPGPGGNLEDIPVAEFDATWETHLRGAFVMTQAVIPQMKKAGGGSIINISSVAGQRVGGHSVAYAVSKAGLAHLSRWAAMELGEFMIRVNTVSPGFVATAIHGLAAGMNKETENSERFDAMMRSVFRNLQPLGRDGETEDVSTLVVYLAGPRSGFVTGADFVIDGGLSLGRKTLLKPAQAIK